MSYKFLYTIFSLFFYLTVAINWTDNIEFSIALKQNNIHIIKDALNDISNPKSLNYGKYWTREKIQQTTATNLRDRNLVTDWLLSSGLSIDDMNVYTDSIYCKTKKIDIVENIFNITFKSHTLNNVSYLISDSIYNIPKKLSSVIVFIEGLTHRQHVRHHKSSTENVVVDGGFASREVIHRLYSIPDNNFCPWNHNMNCDTSTSIGAIEYQGSSGFSEKNLLSCQRMNNQTMKPIPKKHIIGTNMFPDTESELDIQIMSQTAPNADLWFWGSGQWLYTFSINFMNREDIPDVISMSWGWAEDQQCSIGNCTNIDSQKYIDRVNVEYAKIGLRGVSIVVSSGDAGAPGRTSETCDSERPVNPVFPGSSPYVTSLGATFVVANNSYDWNYKTEICKKNKCANGVQEIGTNFEYTGWTAGGGFSIYQSENRPKWQEKAVTDYLNSNIKLPSHFNKNGRSYPDISVVGHSCPIYSDSNQGFMGVDGTSCSSPIFAGIISILNHHQISLGKSKLGFFNPVLYNMFYTDPTIFNDIVVGHNWCTEQICCPLRQDNGSDFGYMATTGYDPVTGLGTPNVNKMIDWLDKHT